MNMEKRNIVLVGMPGAGKSTLGVLLAKALGMDFVDTDILIQQHEKRLLQNIIDSEGIEKFLKIEEDIISETELQSSVIATGGSAVYSEKAMKHLKENGTVVYLHVEYEEIKKRITDITTRGIVLKSGNSLSDAYAERYPLYKRYSDITVDCTGRNIEYCINRIVGELK